MSPDHFDGRDRDDDRLLEAVLWTAGPCTRDEIAAALDWSRPRLHAAESALDDRLTAEISRLARSGTRPSIVIDTAILTTDVRHDLAAARNLEPRWHRPKHAACYNLSATRSSVAGSAIRDSFPAMDDAPTPCTTAVCSLVAPWNTSCSTDFPSPANYACTLISCSPSG